MNMTYTEQGLAMVTDALESGQKLRFTRVEITADPQRSGRDLKHQLEISSVSRAGPKQIRLKAVTDNTGYTSDCYFNRIDIYAEYEGEEVLFCFQQSETCPFYIPAFDGRIVQNEVDVYIIVSSSAAVNLEHDGIYVLQTDYEEDMSAVVEALLDTAAVEEMFNMVYFGIDPNDPSGDGTAMSRQDIENAIKETWDGSSSEDETAMSSLEVEEALETKWLGESSEDEEAMSSADVEEATQN